MAAELVTVTSPDGSKAYAQGSLATHTITSDGARGVNHFTDLWQSPPNLTFPKCEVQEIESAVIRVRGQEICTLGDFDSGGTISSVGDLNASMLYSFTLDRENPALRNLGPKVNVLVEYGPVPEAYQNGEVEQNPNDHENEDISEVYFRDIEFQNDRLPAVFPFG